VHVKFCLFLICAPNGSTILKQTSEKEGAMRCTELKLLRQYPIVGFSSDILGVAEKRTIIKTIVHFSVTHVYLSGYIK